MTETDLAIVATKFIEEALDLLQIDGEIFVEEDEDTLKISIDGEDMGLLIGRRGETLDSLQHLTFQVLCRRCDERKRFILDANDYRERRGEKLIHEADKAAEEVVRSGRAIALDPMTASERRVVHQYLAERDGVQTYSEGEEPYRYLVVELG